MHVTIRHEFSHAILCFGDEKFNYLGSVFNQRSGTNSSCSEAWDFKIHATRRKTRKGRDTLRDRDARGT